MTEAPFFHVGILVPDLREAMARFERVMGLEFAEPTLSHIPQLDVGDGRPEPFDAYITYSKQGAPHIELLEARGDGPYAARHGYGLHHIGMWHGSCQATIDQYAAAALGTEAVFRDGADVIGAYFSPSELYNVRLEVCPVSIRPGWQSWVDGGAGFETNPKED